MPAVGRGRCVGGRAGGDGRLVDVLAVDVDGVGDEGRAPVAGAGVALLEAEELELGLDAFDEVGHCGGWEEVSEWREEREREVSSRDVVEIERRVLSCFDFDFDS